MVYKSSYHDIIRNIRKKVNIRNIRKKESVTLSLDLVLVGGLV
ncbi:transposase [Vibrio crassostreae]|nr:transposase [Vibrio crassostreae]CAK1742003.1 transposase [Vibrio crassostreae]CAK1779910.1 transposase [Vibrio crassostreae]CAK1839553.1 transposase [Vibrio crassostreae]CAK2250715.1 transposase [Vibrio crassostreae]